MDNSYLQFHGMEDFCFCCIHPEDQGLAMPVTEKLCRGGHRFFLWDGDAAQSKDFVLERLRSSRVCLFFLSDRFFREHSLRQLFDTAVMTEKKIILILLEHFEAMPSREKQMSRCQVFHQKDYDNEELLVSVLMHLPLLKACRQSDKTVYFPKNNKICRYILVRQKTGERIPVTHSGFKIGRQKDTCDYALEDNYTVSRVHAVLDLDLGTCTIRDNHSTNKVYINDHPLGPEEVRILNADDRIELGNETFLVHVEGMTGTDTSAGGTL